MSAVNILALVLIVGTACCAAQNRIVGGTTTSIENFPSLVQVDSLGVYNGVWSQSCAGSILTSRHVLSAAHCFDGWTYPSAEYRRIRAGSTYRNTGGDIIYVSQAINHPTFGSNDYDGDITVILLSSALTFSATIAQGTIVTPNWQIPVGTPVTAVGWGTIAADGPSSEELLQVTLFSVDREVCNSRYEQSPWPRTVTPNMICAGILDEGGKDVCRDDAGGPIYVGDTIVGIISWGQGCAEPDYPGVSTAVSSYTNWILSTLGQ